MKNNESVNRYLAGYLDGNGTITVLFPKRSHCAGIKPNITVKLCCCDEWKKAEAMVLEMTDHYDCGSVHRRTLPSGKQMIFWETTGTVAVSLLCRIKKHLVIKGQHADRMIELFDRFKGYGNYVQPEEAESLKDYVRWSRDNTGPIRNKQYASFPWLAGYTDSDGYLTVNPKAHLRFGCHPRDAAALFLIANTFGRHVKEGRENEITLDHIFPKKDPTTAKRILVPMLPHLRLKKWDAEQILASYHPQRLNERNPKG